VVEGKLVFLESLKEMLANYCSNPFSQFSDAPFGNEWTIEMEHISALNVRI
jgi:hypothetical protein